MLTSTHLRYSLKSLWRSRRTKPEFRGDQTPTVASWPSSGKGGRSRLDRLDVCEGTAPAGGLTLRDFAQPRFKFSDGTTKRPQNSIPATTATAIQSAERGGCGETGVARGRRRAEHPACREVLRFALCAQQRTAWCGAGLPARLQCPGWGELVHRETPCLTSSASAGELRLAGRQLRHSAET